MLHRFLTGVIAIGIVASPILGQAKPKYSVEQFLSPSFPLAITAAKNVDRIAWVGYDRGRRNIYTAVAPAFRPVKLTQFNADDGVDIPSLTMSDDGATIVFVRGTFANPSHDPNGAERAVWVVKSSGGSPARLADLAQPFPSPDGKQILYIKSDQIYRTRFTGLPPATPIDKGEAPFIKALGVQSAPRWSPDGSKIAFVSTRTHHSFIGLYDVKSRTVSYPFPGVDRDVAPTWSPDGKRLAFVRRPGTPFGTAVTMPGRGTFVSSTPTAGAVGGQLTPEMRAMITTPSTDTSSRGWPGMYSARFKDGSTYKLLVYDFATGSVREVLTNSGQADGPQATRVEPTVFRWVGESLVFRQVVQGDNWDRYFAIRVDEPNAKPINLIKTDGLIEYDALFSRQVSFSADGKTMFYCTNANDVEHRHIWSVSMSGGEPRQLTIGDGIETSPLALSSGKYLAVLSATATRPELVSVMPVAGGGVRAIERVPAEFPMDAQVVPQVVHTKALDGVDITNELFVPKSVAAGEKRPAIVFVHGGPIRQMLLGYHYDQFYHEAYAVNQWLTTQGYVVLSINYRTGIGFGHAFADALNTGHTGNAEYLDVVAGAKYLGDRGDVDPKRIGIWGLSYGGDLAAQALARNSDLFVAGADLAGVHLFSNSLSPRDLAFQSSAVSAIDKWKSPVFLVQGDDDRNVDFTQMMGLVQLLRQRDVFYDLTVIPDDVHESLIHSRWVDVFTRMGEFMHKYVWELQTPPKQPVERTVPR